LASVQERGAGRPSRIYPDSQKESLREHATLYSLSGGRNRKETR
jgi:hypothetical protein